jgi:hypothetical protein
MIDFFKLQNILPKTFLNRLKLINLPTSLKTYGKQLILSLNSRDMIQNEDFQEIPIDQRASPFYEQLK